MSRRPESERSDWTDLDLLTREEAYGRLQREIAETEALLVEFDNSGGAASELQERRLRALLAAAADLINPGTADKT